MTTVEGRPLAGPPVSVRLRFAAEPASVPRIREAARRWATEAGLGREQVSGVALAVTEAATNAVVHAFVDRPPGTVTLEMQAGDGRALFRVTDDGRGLTPRIDSPGLGLGLPTIGRVVDHFDVGPGPDGGTEVRLAFDAPHLVSGDELRARLHAAYGPLNDAITVNGPDGRIVYANAAAIDLMGADSAEQLTSRSPGETTREFRITREDGRPVEHEELPHCRLLAGEDHPPPLLSLSVHLPTGRARWLETTATLLEDPRTPGRFAVNVIRDVTARTEAARRAQFLSDAGERLQLAAVDLEGTFAEIAALAVPELADWCAVDLAGADGVLDQVALAHPDPEKAALGREINRRWPRDPSLEVGAYGVLRSGEARFIEELGDDLLEVLEPEHRAAIAELGMRSVVLAPMTGRGRVVGVLTLVTAESGRKFTADDVDFACELARRAGLAVDNALRMRSAGDGG